MSHDKVQKVLDDLTRRADQAHAAGRYDEEDRLRSQHQGAHLVWLALFYPNATEVAHLK